MSSLKYKLEALLFSSARSMKIEELSNLTKATPEEIREKINELKKDYEQRDSSITLIDEGNAFKLNIKSEHIPVIQQIVTETELSKTLMETLAVIAFKYPIKQSDLIKIRTNKAYDHLRELEKMGYITRQKYGRTKLIKLTPKFFEYFDLPPEKLKEKFADFGGIAKAIKEKEEEIKKMKEEMKKKAEEAGKKEVDLIDKGGHKQKLEVYEKTEEEEAKEIKPYVEKVGNLEVTDVPEKEEVEEIEETEEEKGIEMTEEPKEEVVEKIKEEIKEEEPAEKEVNRIKDSKYPSGIKEEPKEETEEKPSVENKVDKRVEELLHPKEETEEKEPEKEEQKEETSEEEKPKEEKEEPKDLLEAAAEEEEKKKKDENIAS